MCKKILFGFVLGMVSILLCVPGLVPPVYAIDHLTDNFDLPEINSLVWQVLNETNIALVNSGSLNLRNVDAYRSAFLQNIEPITTNNNLEYQIRFKYNSMGFGAGIALNDKPVHLRELNVHPGLNDWTIFVWPTNSNTFKVFSVSCPATGLCLPTDNPIFTISGADAFDWHILSVRYIDTKYYISLDDQSEVVTMPILRPPEYVWVGNPMVTNGVSFANFLVDYVKIEIPISPPSFPFLSQVDPLWASEEYDSASEWAGVEGSGIDRWGCALTSAAMVLQKYGVKDLSGNEMKPDWLNTWLKSQPDGYIGPGYINWLAIARYAKGRATGGKSLEFERSYNLAEMELPAILGLPGHFVVAHDEDATNWIINDPNLSVGNSSLLKTATVRSINKYELSSTDLSYILLTANSGVTGAVTDATGSAVPTNWIEESLSDDMGGTVPGPSLYTAMIPTPSSGGYTLTIDNSNAGGRLFKIYLYDVIGRVKQHEVNVDPGRTLYHLDFNAVNVNNNQITWIDTTAPPTPTLIAPANGSYVKPSGLYLDWSEVSDPSGPVIYKYKSSWPGGNYGPVTTGTNSIIDASGSPDQVYDWQVQACDSALNCSEWSEPWRVTIDST